MSYNQIKGRGGAEEKMRHNWQPVVVEEVNYKMHSYSSINTFRVLVLLVIFFFATILEMQDLYIFRRNPKINCTVETSVCCLLSMFMNQN